MSVSSISSSVIGTWSKPLNPCNFYLLIPWLLIPGINHDVSVSFIITQFNRTKKPNAISRKVFKLKLTPNFRDLPNSPPVSSCIMFHDDIREQESWVDRMSTQASLFRPRPAHAFNRTILGSICLTNVTHDVVPPSEKGLLHQFIQHCFSKVENHV